MTTGTNKGPSIKLPGLGASLALVFWLGGCGCDDHHSASCFESPPDAIESFRVTTTTGEDGADSHISFCVARRSQSESGCFGLETDFNDFEPGAVDEFVVGGSVAPGDLDSFWIKNRGGAYFGNDEWEIAGLKVVALTSGGEVLLYDEPEICDGALDVGDEYHPKSCSY